MKRLAMREFRANVARTDELVEVQVHGRAVGWYLPASSVPGALSRGGDDANGSGRTSDATVRTVYAAIAEELEREKRLDARTSE